MKPTTFADADCLMHKGTFAIKWTCSISYQDRRSPDMRQFEESVQYLRLAADMPDSFHALT
jgi:hypothetical protein